MATNMYIQFKDIKGEAEDKDHTDWVEILSWSHGFSQAASPIRSSAGSTIERANHSNLSITKYMDTSTTDLLKCCWTGKQIETVKMQCYKADGNNAPINYLMIDLEDVVLSNYSLSGGGGDIPIENLSLAYSKVTYTYNPKKKADATPAGVKVVTQDLATNQQS